MYEMPRPPGIEINTATAIPYGTTQRDTARHQHPALFKYRHTSSVRTPPEADGEPTYDDTLSNVFSRGNDMPSEQKTGRESHDCLPFREELLFSKTTNPNLNK